jgi:hypothetical protein
MSYSADLSFVPLWIDGHVSAAKQLGKPALLEEFGKIANDTDKDRLTVRCVC